MLARSCSQPRPRWRTTRLATGAALAALAAAPAGALAAPGEYVDRADGVAGGTHLSGASSTALWIADDGTRALFTYETGDRASTGIYERNLATNRTTQLTHGEWRATSITTDGATIAVLTPWSYAAGDTDGVNDVYLFNVAARSVRLVETGAGAVTAARISPDGTGVVYTKTGGATSRVPAAGGAAVALGSGNVLATSADGRTAVLAGAAGGHAIATVGAPARAITPPSGYGASWVVRPDGKQVVGVAGPGGRGSGTLSVYDAATGAKRDLPGATTASSWIQAGLKYDPTSTRLVATYLYPSQSARDRYGLALVDLTTGKPTPAGQLTQTPAPYVLSATNWFGLQRSETGHLIGAPLFDRALPGGADPGSPTAFLSYNEGCRENSASPIDGRPLLTFSSATTLGLSPTQVAVVVKKASTGAVLGSFVLKSPYYAERSLIGGHGDYLFELTATFAGGVTTRDRWTVKPYTPALCPPIFL